MEEACKYTVEIDEDKLMIIDERKKGHHTQKKDKRYSQDDLRDEMFKQQNEMKREFLELKQTKDQNTT